MNERRIVLEAVEFGDHTDVLDSAVATVAARSLVRRERLDPAKVESVVDHDVSRS